MTHWRYPATPRAIAAATEPDDRLSGAKAVWREWVQAEEHIPFELRQQIATIMDNKLHARGFPSLQQLLDMIS